LIAGKAYAEAIIGLMERPLSSTVMQAALTSPVYEGGKILAAAAAANWRPGSIGRDQSYRVCEPACWPRDVTIIEEALAEIGPTARR
jgi:hypothetical protein